MDHQKILKGHDDHVITCLQFSNNRIVSGSDDNTLKVRFYEQSFLVGLKAHEIVIIINQGFKTSLRLNEYHKS